ncbi:MAG: zinc-ribbon domain-containing protein [Clostridia bacterium]|nr:zinc-ribbon domain-containing protein [Clostridia bacterium]
MKYENSPCPVCGKPLLETEDVVVCPECATPQHRACWMQTGRCANAEAHGTGFVWQPDAAQAHAQEPCAPQGEFEICPHCGSENPKDALHCGNCGALLGPAGEKICPYCGQKNDDDALHCKYCGAPLTYGAGQPFPRGNLNTDALPFDASERIGEHTAGELAAFVQPSAARYLPKFQRFAAGKGFSFNWAALLFTPFWFFYRKLYKAGILFLLLFAVIPLLTVNLQQRIVDAVMPYAEILSGETQPSDEEAMRMLTEIGEKTAKPMAIIIGAHALLHLIGALTADRIYYKKIRDDLALLREQGVDEATGRFLIARRGGVSILNFLLSFLALELLSQLLYSLADTIASKL